MKFLKSSSTSLRELFDQSITVRYVTEPLASFDEETSTTIARAFMEKKNYDVIGVRQQGLVTKYVMKDNLLEGTIDNYALEFDQEQLLNDFSPLIDLLQALSNHPTIFIKSFGQVGGIVTRGDLQKSPIRMWLFGLISLVEMQLLRIIRKKAHDSWKNYISDSRLGKANDILIDRRTRNQDIDLLDCLQFSDKRDIVIKDEDIRFLLKLDKKPGDKFLKELEGLRNDLAHSQDIIAGRWPRIVSLVQETENLLKVCEDI